MAETDFFMTRTDALGFVSFLIDLASAEFVPAKSTDPPPFPRYSTLAELELTMDGDGNLPTFFVLSAQWEHFPLVFFEIPGNDGKSFFRLVPGYGGPAFEIIPSRTYTDGDLRWIVGGSFSDYPSYIQDASFLTDRSLYRSIKRPKEMTAAHNEVRKYLKGHGVRSVCRETGCTGPWILTDALKEYESRTWLRMAVWHFDPAKKTTRARRTGHST
jgi:hypothetical protein